jgi:hypothetical protein
LFVEKIPCFENKAGEILKYYLFQLPTLRLPNFDSVCKFSALTEMELAIITASLLKEVITIDGVV